MAGIEDVSQRDLDWLVLTVRSNRAYLEMLLAADRFLEALDRRGRLGSAIGN